MAGPWIPALYKILLQPQAIHQGKIMKEVDLARKMKLLGKEMILGGKNLVFIGIVLSFYFQMNHVFRFAFMILKEERVKCFK